MGDHLFNQACQNSSTRTHHCYAVKVMHDLGVFTAFVLMPSWACAGDASSPDLETKQQADLRERNQRQSASAALRDLQLILPAALAGPPPTRFSARGPHD